MRNIEFLALLTANTYKTANIRTCPTLAKNWDIQIEKIPDAVANRIGCIIMLMQERINQNLLCKKTEEYLLIYNIEVTPLPDKNFYWNLAVAINPISKINDLMNVTGNNIILAINGRTGEVMNATKCLLETGAQQPDEINWKNPQEMPISYGNYNAYSPPCCFLAMTSYKSIMDLTDIFKGHYDKDEVIQQGKIFDSFIEASHYFAHKKECGLFIAELPYPKEEIESLKHTGLGKEMLFIVNYSTKAITVTQSASLLNRYPTVQDEIEQFKSVFMDPTTAAPKLLPPSTVAPAKHEEQGEEVERKYGKKLEEERASPARPG